MALHRKTKQAHRFLFLVSLLILLAVACISSAPAAPTQEIPKTILVTQLVTEVVITPTPEPTDTPAPTRTPPPPPTPTATFNPYAVPIYYPLANCVGSRLHVGDVAMVSLGGRANAIRYGVDLTVDNIIDYAQPGQLLDIIGGPYCNSGWIVWQVQTKNGVIGFTPEGNGSEYWLLPTR